MISVTNARFNNPHMVKRNDTTATHFYVMPVYKTTLMLCTQCLKELQYSNHRLITIDL